MGTIGTKSLPSKLGFTTGRGVAKMLSRLVNSIRIGKGSTCTRETKLLHRGRDKHSPYFQPLSTFKGTHTIYATTVDMALCQPYVVKNN